MKTHQDTLAWNKKTFTETELSNKPDKDRTARLSKLFNSSNLLEPISLKEIKEKD